jgi:hypothetical protein
MIVQKEGLPMKRLAVLAIFLALALALLLVGLAGASEVYNFRMSNAPNGPAIISFPTGTSLVYAVFDYTDIMTETIRLRVYDGHGNLLFEQTKTYAGSGTESVAISSGAAPFADGLYVTTLYYASGYVSEAVEWTVGIAIPPSPTPLPGTATPTPTPTVIITPTATPTPTPLPQIQNGGFETGNFTGWSVGGVFSPTVVIYPKHSGEYTALLGANRGPEPAGDSWLYQAIYIPTEVTTATLTFYYWPFTDDRLPFDWQEAQIRDTNGNRLAQVFRLCTTTNDWVPVNFDLTPFKGQTIQVWFNAHGDGWYDRTYMYLDDVSVTLSLP